MSLGLMCHVTGPLSHPSQGMSSLTVKVYELHPWNYYTSTMVRQRHRCVLLVFTSGGV